MAASLGVDAIGLNFHPRSPRAVSEKTASEIVAALPSFVMSVGVFVDLPGEEVDRIASQVGLDRIQLHGDEDLDYCRARTHPVIKAFRTSPGIDPEILARYAPLPLLLDGYRAGLAGGTGRVADWGLARVLVEQGMELILAGGLNAENLADAVRAVCPSAVDLNSGVESTPGIKDRARLTAALDVLGRLRAPASKEQRLLE